MRRQFSAARDRKLHEGGLLHDITNPLRGFLNTRDNNKFGPLRYAEVAELETALAHLGKLATALVHVEEMTTALAHLKGLSAHSEELTTALAHMEELVSGLAYLREAKQVVEAKRELVRRLSEFVSGEFARRGFVEGGAPIHHSI